MTKFYRLLSKHMHDVPDYKYNYKIILDSWENVPQLTFMPGFVLLRKSKQKASSSEHVWRFHKVRRLLLSFCFIPLTFSLNATLKSKMAAEAPAILLMWQSARQKNWREEEEGCPPLLKTLPENLIWHSCLYLICQNLVHGHKLQKPGKVS